MACRLFCEAATYSCCNIFEELRKEYDSDHMWPTKPKLFTVWPLTKLANPCSKAWILEVWSAITSLAYTFFLRVSLKCFTDILFYVLLLKSVMPPWFSFLCKLAWVFRSGKPEDPVMCSNLPDCISVENSRPNSSEKQWAL